MLPYLIRHSFIEVLELYTETKVSQLDGVIREEDVGTWRGREGGGERKGRGREGGKGEGGRREGGREGGKVRGREVEGGKDGGRRKKGREGRRRGRELVTVVVVLY